VCKERERERKRREPRVGFRRVHFLLISLSLVLTPSLRRPSIGLELGCANFELLESEGKQRFVWISEGQASRKTRLRRYLFLLPDQPNCHSLPSERFQEKQHRRAIRVPPGSCMWRSKAASNPNSRPFRTSRLNPAQVYL